MDLQWCFHKQLECRRPKARERSSTAAKHNKTKNTVQERVSLVYVVDLRPLRYKTVNKQEVLEINTKGKQVDVQWCRR